ncbi:MAG TPA: cytochrome P450 [Candidatus Dormibacteraeota bacterium]|nr:cytochrome P450 [Candidatus Dormibacteraeota bacterium]
MRITVPRAPVEMDLAQVDLFDPHLYASGDPYPIWHYLREHQPVWWQRLDDGRGFWSITKYDDVCRVLRDHEYFTSQKGTLLCILEGVEPAGGKMMAVTDPPRHTMMREPLNRALSTKTLRRRQGEIKRLARRLLAPLVEGEPWDLAQAAAGFPMAFTGLLMGVPEEDWPALTRLTTMSIAPDDPDFQEPGGSDATLIAAHHKLFAYFSEQVRVRRRAPRGDLISLLMTMEVGGSKLNHPEIVYNCYSLLLGANVTTPHALAATVMAMIENPDVYRRWAAEPGLLATGVEEGLRWSSPANHFMRYATRDLELRGVQVKAGQALVAWLGSANRDDEAFEDPYRFDPERRPNKHVAFGFGHHYCVGGPLARIALQVLFGEILDTVERFELAGPVEHLCSNFVAGIKRMPVVAKLRQGAATALASPV